MISFSRLNHGFSQGWGAINVFLSNIFDMAFYVFSCPFIFFDFDYHEKHMMYCKLCIVMMWQWWCFGMCICMTTKLICVLHTMFQDHELYRVVSQRNKHQHGNHDCQKKYQHIHILRTEAHQLRVFWGSFGGRNLPSRGLKHRSLFSVLEVWKLRAKVAWSARVVDSGRFVPLWVFPQVWMDI